MSDKNNGLPPIKKGDTYSVELRWEAETFIYKAITGISQTAPVVLTVPGHGLTSDWRVAITNVKGMAEINAKANALKDQDFHLATIIDPNTIEINSINAAGFRPYISGGHIQYGEPVDLTGFTARMGFNTKPNGKGVELFRLTTENGRISIDNATRVITLTISATETAQFDWSACYYDLEMVSNDTVPVVTKILSGRVTVTKEVTT